MTREKRAEQERILPPPTECGLPTLKSEIDFDKNFIAYWNIVFRCAFSITHNYWDAQDATQNAMLHIRWVLHLYDPSRPFEPWLKTVARHYILRENDREVKRVKPLLYRDALKEGHAEAIEAENHVFAPNSCQPEMGALSLVLCEDIVEWLCARNLLNPNEGVVVQCDIEGLETEDTAQRLGISKQAVSNNRFQVSRKRKKILCVMRRERLDLWRNLRQLDGHAARDYLLEIIDEALNEVKPQQARPLLSGVLHATEPRPAALRRFYLDSRFGSNPDSVRQWFSQGFTNWRARLRDHRLLVIDPGQKVNPGLVVVKTFPDSTIIADEITDE